MFKCIRARKIAKDSMRFHFNSPHGRGISLATVNPDENGDAGTHKSPCYMVSAYISRVYERIISDK